MARIRGDNDIRRQAAATEKPAGRPPRTADERSEVTAVPGEDAFATGRTRAWGWRLVGGERLLPWIGHARHLVQSEADALLIVRTRAQIRARRRGRTSAQDYAGALGQGRARRTASRGRGSTGPRIAGRSRDARRIAQFPPLHLGTAW